MTLRNIKMAPNQKFILPQFCRVHGAPYIKTSDLCWRVVTMASLKVVLIVLKISSFDGFKL